MVSYHPMRVWLRLRRRVVCGLASDEGGTGALAVGVVCAYVMAVRECGRLQGLVAVVTGAASGIGRAAALRFVREGARYAYKLRACCHCFTPWFSRVLCVDLNEEGLLETVEQIGNPKCAVALVADVSNEVDSADIVNTCVAKWDRLDVYFANAGVVGVCGVLSMKCGRS